MFFKTPPVITREGAALIKGRRYRLKLVLYAYEQLIDKLTGKFGKGGRSVLTSHRDDLKGPFIWPVPAKAKAVELWKGLAANYEALGEGFTHQFPVPLTAKAYVLGKDWTKYDPITRTHTTSNGQDLSMLDTTPVIELYAKDLPRGDVLGIDRRMTEAVKKIVLKDLAPLKLSFVLSAVETEPGHPQVVATVRFPFEVYGEGEDWIRVRCLSPEGKELGKIGCSH